MNEIAVHFRNVLRNKGVPIVSPRCMSVGPKLAVHLRVSVSSHLQFSLILQVSHRWVTGDAPVLCKVNISAYFVLHLRRKDMQFVAVCLCWSSIVLSAAFHYANPRWPPYSILHASLSPSCMLFVLSRLAFVVVLCCT